MKQKTFCVFSLLFLLLSLVLVPTAPIAAQAPETCCPEPKYASATVDGNPAEWAGDTYFGLLIQPGTGFVLAKVYLRYDCSTGKMYVYVRSVCDLPVQQIESEAWVKVDYDSTAVTFSAFVWVMSGSTVVGWEASFPLTEGVHYIKVHTNVKNWGQWQTAVTSWLCLTIDCPPTAVTLVSSSVTKVRDGIRLKWETASEVNNLGFEIWRNTVKNYSAAKKIKFVASKSPGGLSGASYQWTNRYDSDNPLLAGVRYHYWLVAVENTGAREVFYVGSKVWNPSP